MANSMIEKLD
jgi:hypothetical protein